jgi:multidrug efflux system outer membrane protein
MKTFIILFMLTALFGCTVGPSYRAPRPAVPSTYSQIRSLGPLAATAAPPPLAAWWTVFNDATLNRLIGQAAAANLDIQIAQTRVEEAIAAQGVARSALFPQIGAGVELTRSRQSERSFTGQVLSASRQSLDNNYLQAGTDINWEIDLFGATRRAVEAARADVGVTVEAVRAVRVAVLAEVGTSYLALRGAQKQLAVVRENLHLQEQTLTLTRDQFRAGMSGELDVARAESDVAMTRSQIPPLVDAERRAIHRLGVLLGKPPSELESQLEVVEAVPTAPPRVPVGLPSDLLRRRPDIRSAERQLAGATARIGVATADLYPRFYLTGATNLQSIGASDLLDTGNRFWSLGPSVNWPIFTAGRIRQNIKVQNAREEQALRQYEQTILGALEEVENGLVAFGEEQDRREALVDSEAANRRAAQLAKERYAGGLADFLAVLDAQRSLLAVQEQLAVSDATLGQNLVRLYTALGGGWDGDRPGGAVD